MYLVDTNIFLEILLGQEKKEECKQFLEAHYSSLSLTDFSLHSLGVILFKHKKESTFLLFTEKFLPGLNLLSLPLHNYSDLTKNRIAHNMDFDDAYQLTCAEVFEKKVVTLDKHFKKLTKKDCLFL